MQERMIFITHPVMCVYTTVSNLHKHNIPCVLIFIVLRHVSVVQSNRHQVKYTTVKEKIVSKPAPEHL
jgi:hypothetical protein